MAGEPLSATTRRPLRRTGKTAPSHAGSKCLETAGTPCSHEMPLDTPPSLPDDCQSKAFFCSITGAKSFRV